MSNGRISRSRQAVCDEYYTPYNMVAEGVEPYRDRFAGRHVLLNTNDGDWSAFWQYMVDHYHELGLASLTSLEYSNEHATLFAGPADHGRIHRYDGIRHSVEDVSDSGGYASPSGLAELARADMVVSNPPFSRLGEYLPLLDKADVLFLVVGNLNALCYTDVFPLFQQGRVMPVDHNGQAANWFILPFEPEHATMRRRDGMGRPMARVSRTAWLTNLRTKPVMFKPAHLYNPNVNRTYDGMTVVDCPSRNLIPCDWEGRIGAPASVLSRWPQGWRPIGVLGQGPGMVRPCIDGREQFRRILLERGSWRPGLHTK